MELIYKDIGGGIKVAAISGRIDASNADILETKFNDGLSINCRIVADMAGIDYISSGGLRIFLSTLKKVKAKGGDLKLCALNTNVSKIFKLAGFNKIFQIFETQDLAINSYHGS